MPCSRSPEWAAACDCLLEPRWNHAWPPALHGFQARCFLLKWDALDGDQPWTRTMNPETKRLRSRGGERGAVVKENGAGALYADAGTARRYARQSADLLLDTRSSPP